LPNPLEQGTPKLYLALKKLLIKYCRSAVPPSAPVNLGLKIDSRSLGSTRLITSYFKQQKRTANGSKAQTRKAEEISFKLPATGIHYSTQQNPPATGNEVQPAIAQGVQEVGSELSAASHSSKC